MPEDGKDEQQHKDKQNDDDEHNLPWLIHDDDMEEESSDEEFADIDDLVADVLDELEQLGVPWDEFAALCTTRARETKSTVSHGIRQIAPFQQ